MRHLLAVTWFVALFAGASALSAAIDFQRDIQPIFAKHCYECHGSELQKGKLRLDLRDVALKDPDLIVSRDAAKSELYRRVSLPKGHDDIMPNRGEPLSIAQITTIRGWINEGATWPDNVTTAKHWAYTQPSRPVLPKVKDKKWSRNGIDAFVLARLEKENLRPSPEADRPTLLRRAYLDLIGLPPSPADVDAFLADKSPNAFEKVVDRLLNSPQYGERWARPWLDLARYADSNGYQRDNLWDIWPYRDWVINALNRDLPFDQFTIEQLAGDLLPNATAEQKVATGFNRCTPTNIESGSDQEETRVNQVFDRVNTLGAVWLGTTLECAQCHNHKYDPISQKEYYEMFAFFNSSQQETAFSTPKSTIALKITGPFMDLPDAQIEKKRIEIQGKIDQVTQRIDQRSKDLAKDQGEWESKILAAGLPEANIHVLEIAEFDAESGSLHKVLEDKSILLVQEENEAIPDRDIYKVTVKTKLTGITGFKLDILTDPSLPGSGPGRGDPKLPNFVLNSFTVSITPEGSAAATPVKLRKPAASFAQVNFPVAEAIDGNRKSGWAIRPEFFKDHWATFETTEPVGSKSGSTLEFKLEQNNGGGRTIGRFRISALTGADTSNSLPPDVVEILRQPSATRSTAQQKRLENFYLSQDASLQELKGGRTKLENELKNVRSPQTLVMQELPDARLSSIFTRGSFLQPGEAVKPATPAILHPFTEVSANRLTLARWLVNTNNPLVARVTVNRWWADFFGQGLVRTPEDFGVKGDLPTHPELLDWLAMEFMDPTVASLNSSIVTSKLAASAPFNDSTLQPVTFQPWSMKHMHRLIVTSATYRQSSAITEKLLQKDDLNKLYARGPRFRLEAEMIRDQALAVAGLLSLKQGGPPVRPYQPPGIWEGKVGGDPITYNISEGEDRYRRGVYVVWKRTSPYPSFINFDATERNACTIRRTRSNTPQQALTLLNDPVYVEAAVGLAKRLIKEKPTSAVNERIQHAFMICLGRKPTSNEGKILTSLYQEQLSAAQKDPEAAKKLLGSFEISNVTDLPDFAAWHAVAWALLNLNETITKG